MRFDIHPFNGVDEAREWGRNAIDQAAGAARARYITVTHGQDATYQAKYADAQAFARAGYPEEQLADYPWVAKEALVTGATSRDAADGIKAVGAAWNKVRGPAIEGLRIGGKRALDELLEIAAVVAHTRTVMAQLAAV